jgi:ribosomal protein S7
MICFRRNKFRTNLSLLFSKKSVPYTLKFFFFHFFSLFNTLFALKGSKKHSQSIFYLVIYYLFFEFNRVNPIKILYEIFNRERPKIFLVSKRFGGAVFKLPTPITTFKSFNITFQNFKHSIRSKSGSSFKKRFFLELKNLIIFKNSFLRKKRLEIHRTAYLNYSYLPRIKHL